MQSTKKGNPLVYLFKKQWEYSAGNRKVVARFWGMFIIARCFHLFTQPLIFAEMLNTAQAEGVNTTTLPKLVVLLALTVVIEILFWALHGPARVMEECNAFLMRARYRKHLLRGVMTLPLEWHSDHHSGDTIDKIEKGTSGLYQFSQASFIVVYMAVQLLGSYIVLAWISPPSAIIVAAMVMFTVFITVRFDRVLVEQYTTLNRAENTISESVFDAISNITTVIILRVERLVFDALGHKIDRPYDLLRRNITLNEWKWFLVSMCCALMTVMVLGAYFWRVHDSNDAVLVGSIFLLVQYLARVSDQFFDFTHYYGDILQRASRLMNAEELSKDFKPENFTNHLLPTDWRELAIDNLSFSYEGCEEGKPRSLHLQDVSLTLKHGERIAFVGQTGSGKTTLLKLMRDLYHPLELRLSVDGQSIQEGFAGISRAIALVPQNPEIFATTILENITLGAEYEPAFVRRFTDMACFSDVVDQLPHGLSSSIKEKGVNLSGGQQQRLALSRGLLACSGKDIVLLDEPTSSLDARTEMTVYQNILGGFPGTTIISSIHRLHLLHLFDRICMFDGGKILATGTLEELLATCPEFLSLWEAMQTTEQ